MKRVKAACLCQTLHFMLKDDSAYAVRAVKEEAEQYKARLIRNRVPHKIISETTLPDGSIVMEVKKQYNTSPVGSYLDD